MKILRLDLLAIGPFTDLSLDLSKGEEGLHLVYGPNEAGKSSALRALKYALFGFPTQTADAFLHPYAKLRVGASLRKSNREPIEFVRRKGAKETLRSGDGESPLDPATLARALGGIESSAFEAMFGIDHESLTRGSAEILAASGEIGRVLFAAAAGFARLQGAREGLQKEMDDLFVPNGKNPKINQRLKSITELRRQLKDAQLPSADWLKRQKEIADAKAEVSAKKDEMLVLERKSEQAKSILNAIPIARKRAADADRLSSLGPTPDLADDFQETFRVASIELSGAKSKEERLTEEIDALKAKLAVLGPADPRRLDDGAINRMREAAGSQKKARRDAEGLRKEAEGFEKEIELLHRNLCPGLRIEDLGSIDHGPDRQRKIRKLVKTHTRLSEREQEAKKQLSTANSLVAKIERELLTLAAPSGLEKLSAILEAGVADQHLEEQLARQRATRKQLGERLEIELAKLGSWRSSVSEFERLSPPELATIERYDELVRSSERDLKEANKALKSAQGELETIERDLSQVGGDREIPRESDLSLARSRRDELWANLRRAIETGVTRESATLESASALEEAITVADELSDRLRREADDVARIAHLERAREVAQEFRAKRAEEREDALEETRRIAQEWESTWSSIGASPLPPAETRAWRGRWEKLVASAEEARALDVSIASLESQVDARSAEIVTCLSDDFQRPVASGTPLTTLLELGKSARTESQRSVERRQRLRQDADARREDSRTAEAALEAIEIEWEKWRNEWSETIVPLGLPEDAEPEDAERALAEWKDLEKKLVQTLELRRRWESIESDDLIFRRELDEAAKDRGLDLSSMSVEAAGEAILLELEKALTTQNQRDAGEAQLAKLQAELKASRERREAASAKMLVLRQEAGAQDDAELPEIATRAREAREIRERIRLLDDQLAALAGITPIDEFSNSIRQADPAALEVQVREVDTTRSRLSEELDDSNRRIGESEGESRTLVGATPASEIAERLQSELAGLRDEAESFAQLRLASLLLQRSIDRYRAENEGELLSRAGELFSRMTLGSFEGLRAEYSEREPTIVGLRRGGADEVHVEGMSDGSRDQLYLALRLASLESFLTRHEPIPFVVDDILVHFDDERSAATLEVLAEISKRVQVVFFTHHRRIVELANRYLPDETLFHIELGGRAVSA